MSIWNLYPCYLLGYCLYLIDRLVSLINLYYISTLIYKNQVGPEIHTDPGLVLYWGVSFPICFSSCFLFFGGEGDYGAESEIVLTFDQAEDLVKSLLFVITIIVLLQNKHTTFETIKFFCNFFWSKLAEECPQSCPNPHALWDFFEENIPPMIQRYQKEEDMRCEVSLAEKSTTVLADFVGHLLGPLSSMNGNKVR